MIFEQLYVFFLILQAPTPLPSHRGGTSVSAKSMGSNGLSDDSESFSTQGPWYSSSAKLAVHRPRRTVISSKYKLSPYMMPHSKITVSRLETDIWGCFEDGRNWTFQVSFQCLQRPYRFHHSWVHLNQIIMNCFHLSQSCSNRLWASGCEIKCTCKFS